jgi:hypothetical protein
MQRPKPNCRANCAREHAISRVRGVGVGLLIAWGVSTSAAIAAEVGSPMSVKPVQTFRPLNPPTPTDRLKSMPSVTRPTNDVRVAITPEERGHVDAYFASSLGRLFILNPVRFSQGIKSGKFSVQWEPGSRSALILGEGTRPRPAQVIAGASDFPADTEPKVGDVKFVSLAEKKSAAEDIGSCWEGEATAKGMRVNFRSYTYLTGDGRDSGTETFLVVSRTYLYGLKDCSAEFQGYQDNRKTFMLTAGAWPIP